MTVCISVLVEGGRSAVLLADRRLGMGDITADTALKIGWVHPHWRVLLAGNDFTAAYEISRMTQALLSEHAEADAATVRRAFLNAYEATRLHRAEALHFRSRGWSIEEFKERGREKLPPETWHELDRALRLFDLEVDVVACGFPAEVGEIVVVSNPAIAALETHSGFMAIGSGSIAATTSLTLREVTMATSLIEAMYYVFEAKIAAERAEGVGVPSNMVVLRQNVELLIPESQHAEFRKMWERLKPKDLSHTDAERIRAVLKKGKQNLYHPCSPGSAATP